MEGFLFNLKLAVSAIFSELCVVFAFALHPHPRNRALRDFAWAGLARVLVIRLDEIGDMVMTVPFLRELRRNLPAARITLLTNPVTRNLAETCPYVDEVLSFEAPRHVFAVPPVRSFEFARCCLKKAGFDAAFVPRWDEDLHEALFAAYFSGAAWRIGYSSKVHALKAFRNSGFDRLLTHALRGAEKHEVELDLDILRQLGGRVEETHLELWTSEEDEAFVRRIFAAHPMATGQTAVAFCPGASRPRKTWPLSNFIELGLALAAGKPCRIFVIGGADDFEKGEEIKRRVGGAVVNLAGATTLRQTFALLRTCSLYIGNDTGPAHLAAAAGIPVLMISCHPASAPPFALDSPVRFRPWSPKARVLQPRTLLAPCQEGCRQESSHCISQISAEEVFKEVQKLLLQNKT